MHELGFSVMRKKKGSFVDGREDVVKYRKTFLQRLLVFLTLTMPEQEAPDSSIVNPSGQNLEEL